MRDKFISYAERQGSGDDPRAVLDRIAACGGVCIATTCGSYPAAHCSNSEIFRRFLGQDGRKIENSAEKSRFWGRKAPTDRFPAQFFILLPSRGPVAVLFGDFRAVTRIFARNFSFSPAATPPRSHFQRISEFERQGSPGSAHAQ